MGAARSSQHADAPVRGPDHTLPPALAEGLVDRVVASIHAEPRTRHLGDVRLPSRPAVAELVECLRELVFPGFQSRRGLHHDNLSLHVQELLASAALRLEEQTLAAIRYASDLDHARLDPDRAAEEARRTTRDFLDHIPELRAQLADDVQAAYDGDPAARHVDETIFCYPGVEAVFAHRIASKLLRMGVPLLPRIIQEAAHSRTGIDIHPGARVGKRFFVDHGGAVVIGETAKIGDDVRVYQGVTLGARSFEKDDRGRLLRTGNQRHPTIGDRVTIYAGAVILGGDTVIGDDCVISGGVFLTDSVPQRHVVRDKKPELVMRTHPDHRAAEPLAE